MDFLDRLIDYIEENVELNAVMKVGKLDEKEKATSIRPTPSSNISRSYDAGKTFEYSFQILVKDPNQMLVINLMDRITHTIDGLSNGAIKSADGSFIFVKSEVYVYPSYLEVTDHDEYIYTAMFTAELEGGK